MQHEPFTVTPVGDIRLTSEHHVLRITILRNKSKTLIGMREYRELGEGQWHADKGGIAIRQQAMPTTIRHLLKALEMLRDGEPT